MKMSDTDERAAETLVEIAPDESIVRALAQSAHPIEFIASNGSQDAAAEPRES